MLHHRYWPLVAAVAMGVLIGGALLWRGPAAATSHVPSSDPGLTADSGGSVWGADYFPNVTLLTHEGERVRFFDDLIRDKVVLFNFIYTSCPDTCPMETARMLEVSGLLGDRLGKDVFFYSMTVDPENDTPEVLADFAASWGIPEGWKFLTGDPEDLELVRRKLGVDIDDIESLRLSQHPISLVMGNQATGRWMKRRPFENPYVIADQLGRWLHNWSAPPEVDRDYADAPEIRQISSGEDLFRTRCAACHTIGQGEVRVLAERRIGPDLFKVGEIRDREWLERWIREPDEMLAEGDPIATALYHQYNEIPMPNLRVSATEAQQILGYIDQETRRIERLRAGKSPHHHDGHGGHHGHGGHGETAKAEAPAETARHDHAAHEHGAP
ncbi:MAG TPA: SCO family protein [Thermoanaerobaculia bacterium]|nr:SCO family protein [Thermoanaerobaculia bacterium]